MRWWNGGSFAAGAAGHFSLLLPNRRCSLLTAHFSLLTSHSSLLTFSSLRRLLAVAFLSLASAPAALSQLEPPSTGGIVALDQELRFLGHYKRVLMIGAHPDDEDTELLTVLVRGMGAEAAYLSHENGQQLGILVVRVGSDHQDPL